MILRNQASVHFAKEKTEIGNCLVPSSRLHPSVGELVLEFKAVQPSTSICLWMVDQYLRVFAGVCVCVCVCVCVRVCVFIHALAVDLPAFVYVQRAKQPTIGVRLDCPGFLTPIRQRRLVPRERLWVPPCLVSTGFVGMLCISRFVLVFLLQTGCRFGSRHWASQHL